MITVYGIPNCDSIKKTRRWLEAQSLAYVFHDVRQDGISREQVADWLTQVGSDSLLNRRSTTWKQLTEEQKAVTDPAQVVDLLVTHPTLIKRPVIQIQAVIAVGFQADKLSSFIQAHSGN